MVTSYQGKGIASASHPQRLGPTSSEEAVRDCCSRADLAIVFGAKLSASGTDQWRLPLPERTWRVGYKSRPHPHYPRSGRSTATPQSRPGLNGGDGAARPPWADVAAIRADVEAGARRGANWRWGSSTPS